MKKREENRMRQRLKIEEQTKKDGWRNTGSVEKQKGRKWKDQTGKKKGGGKPERMTERRRSGSNGDAGWHRLRKRDRTEYEFSLSHPFLWVVLLRCLTEKRQRQICSLQPLLATNEFRLHPNELRTELLLHSYQRKTCKARSLEFKYGTTAKHKKHCLI